MNSALSNLKRNYAVNGYEMYFTCVYFYLFVTHIWTRIVTELPIVKGFMAKCNGLYIVMLLYSNANDICFMI